MKNYCLLASSKTIEFSSGAQIEGFGAGFKGMLQGSSHKDSLSLQGSPLALCTHWLYPFAVKAGCEDCIEALRVSE